MFIDVKLAGIDICANSRWPGAQIRNECDRKPWRRVS